MTNMKKPKELGATLLMLVLCTGSVIATIFMSVTHSGTEKLWAILPAALSVVMGVASWFTWKGKTF